MSLKRILQEMKDRGLVKFKETKPFEPNEITFKAGEPETVYCGTPPGVPEEGYKKTNGGT